MIEDAHREPALGDEAAAAERSAAAPHLGGLSDPGKEARSRSGIPVVPVFDGYRAFAIFGVLLLHICGANDMGVIPGADGSAGLVWAVLGRAVELLFIVSGFVVFLPTVARGGDFGSLGAYAVRRAARLLPAYWLILAIALVLVTVIEFRGIPAPSAADVAVNFLGLQVPASLLFSGIPVGFGLDPPLWTLSVELGFYFVLPLLAYRFFRRPVLGLVVALIVTTAWKFGFEHVLDIASALGIDLSASEGVRVNLAAKLQLPAWAYSFALGMIGAWAYVTFAGAARTEPGRSRVRLALALAAAGLIASIPLTGAWTIDSAPSLAVSALYSTSMALAMVAVALGPEALRAPFANRHVRALGDIAYGVYLCHMVLIYLWARYVDMPASGTVGGLAVWCLAVIPLSLLYGYLSARLLEQPIRRWARKYGRRQGD